MTSAQYANLLLKKMQVYFSCSDTGLRAYLYNFYGEIFTDPSVILTQETYQAFVDQMEEEVNYAAQNNLYTLEQIYYSSRFNDQFVILQNSFAAIGITLTLTKDSFGYPSKLEFALPSGEVKVWKCQTYNDYAKVCAQLRCTDDYARRMRSFYLLSGEDAPLLEEDINVAGLGTKWTWMEEEQTVSVTGEGTLASYYLWSELGFINQVKNIMVGSGVTEITKWAMAMPDQTNFIFLQSENAPVKIHPQQFTASSNEGAKVFTYHIYTDNLTIRNNDYGDNPNVVLIFHPLDEWDLDVLYNNGVLTIVGDLEVVQQDEDIIITE